jgi:hypothetical protein
MNTATSSGDDGDALCSGRDGGSVLRVHAGGVPVQCGGAVRSGNVPARVRCNGFCACGGGAAAAPWRRIQ